MKTLRKQSPESHSWGFPRRVAASQAAGQSSGRQSLAENQCQPQGGHDGGRPMSTVMLVNSGCQDTSKTWYRTDPMPSRFMVSFVFLILVNLDKMEMGPDQGLPPNSIQGPKLKPSGFFLG